MEDKQLNFYGKIVGFKYVLDCASAELVEVATGNVSYEKIDPNKTFLCREDDFDFVLIDGISYQTLSKAYSLDNKEVVIGVDYVIEKVDETSDIEMQKLTEVQNKIVELKKNIPHETAEENKAICFIALKLLGVSVNTVNTYWNRSWFGIEEFFICSDNLGDYIPYLEKIWDSKMVNLIYELKLHFLKDEKDFLKDLFWLFTKEKHKISEYKYKYKKSYIKTMIEIINNRLGTDYKLKWEMFNDLFYISLDKKEI